MIAFSIYVRTRSMAKHTGLEIVPETLRNTRTTYAGLIGRLTAAPLQVNYHLESL